MFEKMKDTIDFVMEAKKTIRDQEVLGTIITTAANCIINDYMLLIPNDKNLRDVQGLAHIDGAQVFISEQYENTYEFGVREVLNEKRTTEDVINFFKKNSIIAVNEHSKIQEYRELAKVAEELTATRSRYFERRNVATTGWRNATAATRNLDNFWRKQTENEEFIIESIGFDTEFVSLYVKHEFKFDPKKLMNYEKPVHVVNSLAHQLAGRVKSSDSIIRGYKSKVINLTIHADIKVGDIVGVEHTYVSPYADKSGVDFYVTGNSSHRRKNITEWGLRVEIPFREFMNRVAEHYKNKVK